MILVTIALGVVFMIAVILVVRAAYLFDHAPIAGITDPERREALRLANMELDEMDWRNGIGPKPKHLQTEALLDRHHEGWRRLEPINIPIGSFNPPPTVMSYIEYDSNGVVVIPPEILHEAIRSSRNITEVMGGNYPAELYERAVKARMEVELDKERLSYKYGRRTASMGPM